MAIGINKKQKKKQYLLKTNSIRALYVAELLYDCQQQIKQSDTIMAMKSGCSFPVIFQVPITRKSLSKTRRFSDEWFPKTNENEKSRANRCLKTHSEVWKLILKKMITIHELVRRSRKE